MAKAKKTQTVLYGSAAIEARFQKIASTPPNAMERYELALQGLRAAGISEKEIHGDKDAAKGTQARRGMLTKPDAEKDHRALVAMLRSAIKRLHMGDVKNIRHWVAAA